MRLSIRYLFQNISMKNDILMSLLNHIDHKMSSTCDSKKRWPSNLSNFTTISSRCQMDLWALPPPWGRVPVDDKTPVWQTKLVLKWANVSANQAIWNLLDGSLGWIQCYELVFLVIRWDAPRMPAANEGLVRDPGAAMSSEKSDDCILTGSASQIMIVFLLDIIWTFPKIVGFPPKSSILIGVFHSKPSILGYPYFWKHPYWKNQPKNLQRT